MALLSSSLGHERITLVRWAGVILSLAGIYLVVGQANQQGASLAGDLLILGAMLCWAGYTVGSRSLLTRHSPLVVTGITMTIGSALYAPFGVPSLLRLDWTAVSWWAWVLLVYSAVFALVVAYLIWYTAVQRVGNNRTSIYSNVVPLVAMAVAAAVLGEPITARKIAGAIGDPRRRGAHPAGVAVRRRTPLPRHSRARDTGDPARRGLKSRLTSSRTPESTAQAPMA